MRAQTYQRILQWGIFASLGVVFLLFSSLLFPYISSKQIVFNILMELLLPFWLLLVIKFPQFRPYRSLLTWGLLSYLLVILITAFTGIDFNLSFWGDVERMLGLFHIFHFFLFYLYLITAFRSAQDWYWLLSASVLVATVEAMLVLFMQRIGTIGNTAYISGYLLFNLYFALILIVKTEWKKQWPFYVAIIFMLLAFFKANTSGAIIGLASSLLLLFFLLGILSTKKKIRRLSLSVVIIALTGIILLFSQYNQDWFKANRVLSNLSMHKATFQTRRLSWEGAMRDFNQHPWLGNGLGNYAAIFDRQFDPSFFNYTTSETYFDRAHNNLIDIASTTGIVGLLAYLSIFFFLFKDWRQALKKESWRIQTGREGNRARELVLLAALITAYFVQNLAVFDSLVTYMGLMLTVAYIIFLKRGDRETEVLESSQLSPKKERVLFILFMMIALIIVSQFNIKPLKMMTKTIDAYARIMSGEVEGGFTDFQSAFVPATVLDRDGRSVLINFVINNPTILTRLPANQIETNLEFVLSLAERNLLYNPQDSLMQMQLAQLYDVASRYFYQDPDQFRYYSEQAKVAAQKAIEVSPRRIPAYFVLAQIQANSGDLEAAESSFLTAYNFNPDYVENHCQLANYYFLIKKDIYLDYADTCLKKGSQNLVPDLLVQVITEHYEKPEKAGITLLAYRALAAKGSRDTTVYINLAKLELAAGNFQAAIDAAVMAAQIDEELRPMVEQFLKDLEKDFEQSLE